MTSVPILIGQTMYTSPSDLKSVSELSEKYSNSPTSTSSTESTLAVSNLAITMLTISRARLSLASSSSAVPRLPDCKPSTTKSSIDIVHCGRLYILHGITVLLGILKISTVLPETLKKGRNTVFLGTLITILNVVRKSRKISRHMLKLLKDVPHI